MKPKLNLLDIIQKVYLVKKKKKQHCTNWQHTSSQACPSCFGAVPQLEWGFRGEGVMTRSVLAPNLQLSARKFHQLKFFSFLHNNDPKHTSKSTTDWLHCSEIKLLDGLRVQTWIPSKRDVHRRGPPICQRRVRQFYPIKLCHADGPRPWKTECLLCSLAQSDYFNFLFCIFLF